MKSKGKSVKVKHLFGLHSWSVSMTVFNMFKKSIFKPLPCVCSVQSLWTHWSWSQTFVLEAANPSCTEVWWPSHCVSVYLPHSKCVPLIKLIIRVKQWQVIKSQTVITAANYRDAHKHELDDGSLQVPSICFPIKMIFLSLYSTVMFIHCKNPSRNI